MNISELDKKIDIALGYVKIPVKVLKGKEADGNIWLGNYRNGLYKNRFIKGHIVDGIMNYPQTNFGEPLKDI